MSRLLDLDFKHFEEFISNYNLRDLKKNPSKLKTIKSTHKIYLASLQLWAICDKRSNENKLKHFEYNISAKSQQITHLREAISDIGGGFLCCLHGAYKPGHMSLRSSIENFLRFSAGTFSEDALKTTSISDLFDISKETEPFKDSRACHLNTMRSAYTELCKYTHSASLSHMSGVHALAHFPSYDEKTFNGWFEITKKCLTSLATIIIAGHPKIYLNAHFTAQELLDFLLTKEEKLTILKGSHY